MKYSFLFSILFSLFSFSQITAQDIISDITSEGNEQRHILQDVDGVPYIIKVSSLDSLYTYDLSNGLAELMHTNYTIGAYEDFYQKHAGKWLLYERPDGAAAYDFINNEFILFPYLEDINRSLWRIKDFNTITLEQSSPDYQNKKYYLFDIDLNILDTSELVNNLRSVTDQHYILEKRIDSNIIYTTIDKETFTIYNQLTLQLDQRRVYDGSNLFFGKNNNTDLWHYNFDTGIETLLHSAGIESYRQEFSQIDNFFIFNSKSDETFYSIVFSKYDLSKKVFLDQLLSDSDLNGFGNSLIFENNEVNDSLFIYNFDTPNTAAYESYLNVEDVIIIDDRYLITRGITEFYFHDLQDGTTYTFYNQIPFSYRLNIQQLKVDDKIYIDLGTDIESLHDLLVIDMTSKELSNSSIIPFARRGLIERSFFHSIGEDIFVLNDEHLYNIVEDSVYQLDQNTIIENKYLPYSLDKDGLFWAEKNDTLIQFFKYTDGSKNLLTTIIDNPTISLYSFRPSAFFDGDKFLYVYGDLAFDRVLYVINKQSGEIISNEDVDIYPSAISFYNNGYFYFRDETSLFGIDEDGNKHLIDIELPLFEIGSYIKYDNQAFIANEQGIYRIEGTEAIEEFKFDNTEVFLHYFTKIQNYLLLTNTAYNLIYKDGQWLPLDFDLDSFISPLGEEYLMEIKSTGNNQRLTVLYQIESDQTIQLPDEINTLRILDLFKYYEDQYIITMEGSLPNYTVKVFKMSADFTVATEVKSFETTGRGINATFTPYGDEGLLYAGDKLFLMNDLLEFILLDGITGDNTTTEIAEKNGTFYFIAKNAEKGRQVHKVVAFSERVSTKDISWNETIIYPNPSNSNINWTEESTDRIQIYNQNGKLILDILEFNNNSIDISMLQLGMYNINLIDTKSQKIKTGRFIKI